MTSMGLQDNFFCGACLGSSFAIDPRIPNVSSGDVLAWCDHQLFDEQVLERLHWDWQLAFIPCTWHCVDATRRAISQCDRVASLWQNKLIGFVGACFWVPLAAPGGSWRHPLWLPCALNWPLRDLELHGVAHEFFTSKTGGVF